MSRKAIKAHKIRFNLPNWEKRRRNKHIEILQVCMSDEELGRVEVVILQEVPVDDVGGQSAPMLTQAIDDFHRDKSFSRRLLLPTHAMSEKAMSDGQYV